MLEALLREVTGVQLADDDGQLANAQAIGQLGMFSRLASTRDPQASTPSLEAGLKATCSRSCAAALLLDGQLNCAATLKLALRHPEALQCSMLLASWACPCTCPLHALSRPPPVTTLVLKPSAASLCITCVAGLRSGQESMLLGRLHWHFQPDLQLMRAAKLGSNVLGECGIYSEAGHRVAALSQNQLPGAALHPPGAANLCVSRTSGSCPAVQAWPQKTA